jgi:hypothetical protein
MGEVTPLAGRASGRLPALRSIRWSSMLKRLNRVVNGLPLVARTMASEAVTAS